MANCIFCGKSVGVAHCVCGDCMPKRGRGKLPKDALDAMIEAERAYWGKDVHGNEEREELLDAMSAARTAMEEKLQDGKGVFSLSNFLSGMLSVFGLAPDATNAEIYTILRLIGWEVV